eukprot:gene1286-biopygen10783
MRRLVQAPHGAHAPLGAQRGGGGSGGVPLGGAAALRAPLAGRRGGLDAEEAAGAALRAPPHLGDLRSLQHALRKAEIPTTTRLASDVVGVPSGHSAGSGSFYAPKNAHSPQPPPTSYCTPSPRRRRAPEEEEPPPPPEEAEQPQEAEQPHEEAERPQEEAERPQPS